MTNGEKDKISLCAKWIPRESSQFSWFFKLLARNFFDGPRSYFRTAYYNKDNSTIMRAEKKGYMEYRKLISSVNRVLDTTQIKQCGGEWSKIDHNKTTSITLIRNKRAFLNVNKKNNQRSNLQDRIWCAYNFKKYITTQIKSGKEIKGKRVGMEEFTVKALQILSDCSSFPMTHVPPETIMEKEMLNSQWRDNSSQTGKLGKMIAMVDTSGSMDGNPLHVALALSIRVAEKSILGKRVLTFSKIPEWHDLSGSDGFVEMVDVLHKANWGMNTDFFKAFDLILDALIENQIPPEDVDGLILTIFSDMQIDQACNKFNNETMHKKMERKFNNAGYKLPHIVFWNLRITNGFPTLSTTRNCSMMSGYSPQLLNQFCEMGLDALQSANPYHILEETLSNNRYNRLKIHFQSQV
jgi:hypothetical protein